MIDSLKFSTLKFSASRTIERFPFFALLALSYFVLSLGDKWRPFDMTGMFFEDGLKLVYYIILYAVPFTLAAENLGFKRLYASVAALALGLVTWQLHRLSYTPYEFEAALTCSSILFCTVAPFIKNGNNDRLCFYWYTALTALMWTVIPCAILSFAIYTLQFSLEKLFGIIITDFGRVLTYGSTWMLLAPLLFFGQLPTSATLNSVQECVAPKPIKVILTWLLIPIVLAFFFILYAYFIKVAVTQENVRGILVNLIMWYSVFGLVVLLVSYPLLNEDNKAARTLHKYFFAVLLLPAAIIIWRVWVRIDSYGLTVDRILATAFGVWLLIIAALYAFRSIPQRPLRFIPLSLAVIILLMYAGPWDPQSVANHSQEKRLIAVLSAEHLYEDGHVIVKNPKPRLSSFENQREIIEAFDYLNHNHLSGIRQGADNAKPHPLTPFFKGTALEHDFIPDDNVYFESTTFGSVVLSRLAVLVDDNNEEISNISPHAYVDFFGDREYRDFPFHVIKGYDTIISNAKISIHGSPPRISFGLSPDPSEEKFTLQPILDKASVVTFIIRNSQGAVIDTIRIDVTERIIPYAKGTVKKAASDNRLMFEAQGKVFALKLEVDDWTGYFEYPNRSENNKGSFYTSKLTASILLKKR